MLRPATMVNEQFKTCHILEEHYPDSLNIVFEVIQKQLENYLSNNTLCIRQHLNSLNFKLPFGKGKEQELWSRTSTR